MVAEKASTDIPVTALQSAANTQPAIQRSCE